MFTDVHLLAAAFCSEKRDKYMLSKLKLTKDGKAIASNGVLGIIVGPTPFPDKHEMKNDLYVEKKDAQRIFNVLKKIKREGKWGKIFDIDEISDKEYKVTQPNQTICFTHDTDVKFPDVEVAVENVNPKKKEGCKFVRINLGLLKKIVDQLCEMAGNDKSVEMFFGNESGKQDSALRIETKGRNEEKIEATLMQTNKF